MVTLNDTVLFNWKLLWEKVLNVLTVITIKMIIIWGKKCVIIGWDRRRERRMRRRKEENGEKKNIGIIPILLYTNLSSSLIIVIDLRPLWHSV